jgi:large subunit ribosomal protein L6
MTKISDIKESISIPDSVQVEIDQGKITVRSDKGELSRHLYHPKISMKIKDKQIEVNCKNPRRKDKALTGTFIAHINNMLKGVTESFEYKMKTVYSHFPIKTAVEGNDFVIQNFLGERSARRAKIIEGVRVEAKGDDVIVSGIDKEKVGQTVANIERSTAVKRRDIRVFQDGVYRISKGGD